jgi:formate dehydrogenase major subunit
LTQVSRRSFLKVGAASAAAVTASGLGFDLAHAQTIKQQLKIQGAKELHSICPYCAVGCSLVAYTKQNANGSTQLLQIEGDPNSPVNEGRLCPKGASAMQLATSQRRVETPMYRAPGSDKWVAKDWNFVLDKIAGNLKASRDRTFIAQDASGNTVNRTEGVAFAGGAAFSSEEGYFAAKVMRTLGLVYLEQQARV